MSTPQLDSAVSAAPANTGVHEVPLTAASARKSSGERIMTIIGIVGALGLLGFMAVIAVF